MKLRASLLRSLENVLILGFVVMIAIVFGNVVMRYAFNSGLLFAEELSRMIFVWLTFGGALIVAREGGHLGMNMVVQKFDVRGRWWCRIISEGLSLFCMVLLVMGCWSQTILNLSNIAPITGIPTGVVYAAGIFGGLGIGTLNIRALYRLLTGQIADIDLVTGIDSEELAAFEQRQLEKKLQHEKNLP